MGEPQSYLIIILIFSHQDYQEHMYVAMYMYIHHMQYAYSSMLHVGIHIRYTTYQNHVYTYTAANTRYIYTMIQQRTRFPWSLVVLRKTFVFVFKTIQVVSQPIRLSGGGGEFGDGLGALGDGVLGKLSWKEKSDSSLDLPR